MIRRSAADRVYRVLLHVLPRDVRARYGDEMSLLFRHRLAAARGARRVEVWLRALGDLLRHGAAEHLRERGRATVRVGGSFSEGRRDHRGRILRRVLGAVAHDLHFAVRMLRKNPGFSAVLVITLALGIGANTALFSVVHGVLLQPLPYPESEHLVYLQEVNENGEVMTVSYPNFADWREQATGVSEVVAGYPRQMATVYSLHETVAVPAMGISRGFFRTFGAEMALGRPILDEENTPTGPAVIVVSYRFWSRWLGSEPNLESISLDLGWDETLAVVGVMRPGFRFLDDVDIWYPFERGPTPIRNAHNHWVVGRLADGVDVAAARAELGAIAAAIKERYPDESQAVSVRVTPLHDRLVDDSRRPLWILMAASTLVLLVACTNVASSLLARGSVRNAELAVRRALGAGRGRLLAQLLTESLLLAGVGAVAGIALAEGSLRVLRVVAAGNVPRLDEVGLTPAVLVFSLSTTMFAALLFGLVPALRVTRGPAAVPATYTHRVARSQVWRGLVGIEVALCVVLLVGSGLLVRSLVNIVGADAGYDRRGVLTIGFELPGARYDNADRIRVLRRLREDLAALPGVSSVGLANALPLASGFKTGPVVVPPYVDPEDPDEWRAIAHWRVADAGYFEALGIETLRGRVFGAEDAEGRPGVAVVNRPLAERLWPGEDPLGRRVRALWDFRGEDLTVIGVVDEARHWGAEPGTQLELYVPWEQRAEHAAPMTAVVLASLPPAALSSSAREVLRSVDGDLLGDIATLDERLVATLASRNFNLVVLGGFAAVALLLSLSGIYGVVSYTVAQRTREIGIRLALGARPASVRAMVQRHTMAAAGAGAACGCLVAAAASQLMSGLLYGVEPMDGVTFVAAPSVLLAVATLASYIPARRSARVDPVRTMRAE